MEATDEPRKWRRRPVNGYPVFVSEIISKNYGLPFAKQSVLAANIWNKLTVEEKLAYKSRAVEDTKSAPLSEVSNKYMCGTCDRTFGQRHHMNYHQKYECGVKLECEPCKKRFNCYSSLQRHKRIVHDRELTFDCRICQKRFQCRADLTIHFNIHIGIRFACQMCGASLSNKSNLTRHTKKCDKSSVQTAKEGS